MNEMPATVVVICGPPGSGKTTLSRMAGRALELSTIDTDGIINAVSPKYIEGLDATAKFGFAKDVAFHFVQTQVLAGQSIILDVCFPDLRDWDRLKGLADSFNAKLAVFRLVAPFSILLERVSARARAGSTHILKHDEPMLRAIVDRANATYDAIDIPFHELNATASPQDLCTELLDHDPRLGSINNTG